MEQIKIQQIIFFILVAISIVLSQSVDSVVLKMEDMRAMQTRWQEWECEIYAYLYKNGNYIQPQENFTYTWYWKEETETQFKINSMASGTGVEYSYRYEDGMYYQYFDNYVVVNGPDFTVTSVVLSVGKDGSAHPINLLAKSQNGTYLSLEDYIREFTDPRWKRSHFSGVSAYFFLNEERTLWTNTRIIGDDSEKFY